MTTTADTDTVDPAAFRAWARDEGIDVPQRGRIPSETIAAHRASFEAAAAAAGDYGDGTGPADFTQAADPPGGPETPAGETKPRRPTRARPAGKRRFWDRRSGSGAKPKAKTRKKFPRLPVDTFIEHFWSQAAWAARPLPPLQRMLTAQAPIAGIIFEDVVRDTVADTILQPVVRLERQFKALDALIAPPILVTAITLTGVTDDQGRPDARTSVMLGMLRFSLMSMYEFRAGHLDEVIERGRQMEELGDEVDRFMAHLFEMPAPPAGPDDPGGDEVEGEVISDSTEEEEAMARARQAFGAPPFPAGGAS